jgi:hypothetical protein
MAWLDEETRIESAADKQRGPSKVPFSPEAETWLEDPDVEVLNQLLVSSEGKSLALHDPWRMSTRRVRREIGSDTEDNFEYRHEYFCILDVRTPSPFLSWVS